MKRFVILTVLLFPIVVHAGISSIAAHGESFSASATIPVFVESGTKNSIMVKGQFMDLATGVESSDSSFSVNIGRRIMGAASALEVLIGAGSAPDEDGATITIKFVSGQETFKIKAFKTNIDDYRIEQAAFSRCSIGETVVLRVTGDVEHLIVSAAGAMLDVADDHYDIIERLRGTPRFAEFSLKCTKSGTFTIKPSWFRDSRVASPAGEKMVRGNATFTVTVDPLTKQPVP